MLSPSPGRAPAQGASPSSPLCPHYTHQAPQGGGSLHLPSNEKRNLRELDKIEAPQVWRDINHPPGVVTSNSGGP